MFFVEMMVKNGYSIHLNISEDHNKAFGVTEEAKHSLQVWLAHCWVIDTTKQ